MRIDPMQDLIPAPEAARLYGCSREVLVRMITSGRLEGRRLGTSWFVDGESLAKAVEQKRRSVAPSAAAAAR